MYDVSTKLLFARVYAKLKYMQMIDLRIIMDQKGCFRKHFQKSYSIIQKETRTKQVELFYEILRIILFLSLLKLKEKYVASKINFILFMNRD